MTDPSGEWDSIFGCDSSLGDSTFTILASGERHMRVNPSFEDTADKVRQDNVKYETPESDYP